MISNTLPEKKLVLVLDDNETDLTIASFLITKEGFEPKTFNIYPAFLEFLNQNHSDVQMILMDNEMPGLLGVDIVKRLKRIPHLKTIPVVMMTGDSTPTTVQKAIQCGAVDYIVKPIDPLIFESKLRKHLNPNAGPQQTAQWIEYKLGQIKESPVDLKVPGVLVSIGEMSVTLRTEYEVAIGSVFVVDTQFFRDLDISAVPLRVDVCSEIPGTPHYLLSCAIIGLTENDLRKIRLFCKTLFSSNIRISS